MTPWGTICLWLSCQALLCGCANSVEYAAPAEEVIVLADGSPYRRLIELFAVSRDGNVIAFPSHDAAFGPPGLVVFDRRTRTGRTVCEAFSREPRRGEWALSEDARYAMIQQRRCDLETGDIVNLEVVPTSVYGSIAFFPDGSGVAYYDPTVSGVRVAYYDGRADVVIPLELPPRRAGDGVVIASDRRGTRLFVSGYYYGAPSAWSELGAEHWLVSLPEGMAQRFDAPRLGVSRVNGIARPGVFSDDGTTLRIVASGSLWRIDLETLARTPSAGRSLTDELDDGRVVAPVRYERGQSEFAIPIDSAAIGVRDGEESQLLRADLSAFFYPPLFERVPIPELVVAAPESHEVFLSLPLFEREGETGGLVVVPVPPREVP